jgi:hypothetical protein
MYLSPLSCLRVGDEYIQHNALSKEGVQERSALIGTEAVFMAGEQIKRCANFS